MACKSTRLALEDVRVSVAASDERPVVHADTAQTLVIDGFRFTPHPDANRSMQTNKVHSLILRDTSLTP